MLLRKQCRLPRCQRLRLVQVSFTNRTRTTPYARLVAINLHQQCHLFQHTQPTLLLLDSGGPTSPLPLPLLPPCACEALREDATCPSWSLDPSPRRQLCSSVIAGLMGTMGASMAGSVAGSMLGNAISNSMSGGSSAPVGQPQVAQGSPMPMQAARPLCSFESRQFLQCMTNANDDLEQCRGFYDAFKMCQSQAAM